MICAIYCRISREDDCPRGDASESIQNQRAMLTGYASDRGWEIFSVYCDEDYSGMDRSRPAWREMLADAERGKFSLLLCKTQSRFTRDMELVERYLHTMFPLWGIRFVTLVDNADTEVRGNKKARQINGLINEWYLEDLSENIRAVLDQKRRAGRFIGSSAVYGYRRDPDDHGHLVIDNVCAENVRRIFSLYLDGSGVRRIAALLNQSGVAGPTAYKTGGGAAHTHWSHTAVSRILRCETYIGRMVQGKKRRVSYKTKKLASVPRDEWIRVEATHEAIIDPGTFERAQKRLGMNLRSDGTGIAHPLCGHAFCADCGAPLVKSSCFYNGNKRSYLRCKRHADCAAPNCTSHSIRLDRLVDCVRERIAALLDTAGVTRELGGRGGFGGFAPATAAAPAGAAGGRLRRELSELRRKAARTARGISALYLDRTDGVLTPEQFTDLSGELMAEQKSLKQQILLLEAALDTESSEPAPDTQTARALLDPEKNLSALISLLIDRVEVCEPQSKASREIRIRWNI